MCLHPHCVNFVVATPTTRSDADEWSEPDEALLDAGTLTVTLVEPSLGEDVDQATPSSSLDADKGSDEARLEAGNFGSRLGAQPLLGTKFFQCAFTLVAVGVSGSLEANLGKLHLHVIVTDSSRLTCAGVYFSGPDVRRLLGPEVQESGITSE